MLFDILFIIILLTLIYGYLIYLVIIQTNFKNKVMLVLSILLLFVAIQFEFFKNLGYPSSEWPKSQRRPIDYVTDWNK